VKETHREWRGIRKEKKYKDREHTAVDGELIGARGEVRQDLSVELPEGRQRRHAHPHDESLVCANAHEQQRDRERKRETIQVQQRLPSMKFGKRSRLMEGVPMKCGKLGGFENFLSMSEDHAMSAQEGRRRHAGHWRHTSTFRKADSWDRYRLSHGHRCRVLTKAYVTVTVSQLNTETQTQSQ
jgi:hypothetical protein